MTGRIVRREDILEVLTRIDAAKAQETIKRLRLGTIARLLFLPHTPGSARLL